MASNKNQHFVPRCYLKPFTLDENNVAISVYNIDSKKLIKNAPVKNQCSKSYFYGQNELLENAIQSMEGAYANFLRAIRLPNHSFHEECSKFFKRFWWFQHLRTEAASKRAAEMNNEMGAALKMDSSFNLEIKDSVDIAMGVFADSIDRADDLKGCLIKNNTQLPFITSDDPAILTNKWFQLDNRFRGETFGLRSAGAILLMPLTPKILFCAYDPDVYAIQKSNGWANITNENDVLAFNQHQFLNCRAVIFPGEILSELSLTKTLLQFKKSRISQRHKIHYAVLDESFGEHKRYKGIETSNAKDNEEAIVHAQTIHPKAQIWPSIIRWRRNGFGMSNNTGTGCIRKKCIKLSDGIGYDKLFTNK